MNCLKSVASIILLSVSLINTYAQGAIQFREEGASLWSVHQAQLSLSEFTIECWLMRNGEGTGVITGRGGVEAIPVISKGMENPAHESGLNFFLGIRKEDSVLVFDFESSRTSAVPFQNYPVTGFHPLKNNTWYHVAVTYNGSMLRLYLNGKLETARETGKAPATDEVSAFVIGGVADISGQFYGQFVGKIDELRIWDYARSQQELLTGLNSELSTVETHLITQIGFNEGSGNVISAIGAIQQLTFTGSGWEWTEGAPFNALIPPVCEDAVILKIGLIADPQYCDCAPSGTRIYRETLTKLPVAIDSMNKFQVDFVMNLGDMIDRYYESYDTISQLYKNLAMPYYNLLGNHEFEEMADTQKPLVLSHYGMPDYYYGFSVKNWRFLVLDGTELAAYSRILHPELAEEGDSLFQQVQGDFNDRPWNGGIGRIQRKWISDQLQAAIDMEQNVILFCHFPVYPDTVYLNLWNYEEIIALIEDYPNVVAYINGHYHPGNYGFKKGIHYVNQSAMLDTYENNSFTLLEIHADKLVFKGSGLNHDMIISYENHFKAPFRIYLTDTIIHPTYHADSYIGSFSSSSGSGINYSLYNDSLNYKNNCFFISHDSLFVKTNMDLSVSEEITIKVLAITCLFDTVSEVFRLKYNTPILDVTRLQDEALLKLYPNPLSGTLHIDLNQPIIAEPVELIITDMNGRVMKIIQHFSVNPFTGIIEVTINADIPVGIYLVKISQPSQKDVFGKLIIRE